jgi:hypothetical protein
MVSAVALENKTADKAIAAMVKCVVQTNLTGLISHGRSSHSLIQTPLYTIFHSCFFFNTEHNAGRLSDSTAYG